MSVFGQLVASDVITTGPFADRYYEGRTQTVDGITTSDFTAMGNSGFYACLAYISEDIGKSPFGVWRDLGDRGRERAPNHPIDDLIRYEPNAWQTSLEWREMIQAIAFLRGYSVSELKPGKRGPVDTIVPLHPDLVVEKRLVTGDLVYDYQDPMRGYQVRRLTADEVMVLRNRLGRGIVDIARDEIINQAAQQSYLRQTFTRSARFQGVLQHPKTLSPGARTALRAALTEYEHGGAKAGRPMLLEEGMTWTNVSLTNRDAQFLDILRWGIDQWARYFRIPPHKVQELSRSTNNNIEQQSIDYVTDSLLGPVVRLEMTANRALILGQQYYTKVTLDALMRGDTLSRYQAYNLACTTGWLLRSEVREKEDLNPIPGMEEPLSPLNMGNAGRATGGADQQAVAGYLRLFASDAAGRIVRREAAAVAKLAEKHAGDWQGYRDAVADFYRELGAYTAQALHLPEHVARGWAADQLGSTLAGTSPDEAPDRVGTLADLVLSTHHRQQEYAA